MTGEKKKSVLSKIEAIKKSNTRVCRNYHGLQFQLNFLGTQR